MLKVMLCGASDMDEVVPQFIEVTRSFGAEPLYYLSGEINYLNRAGASWVENSRTTVSKVDLCVFVILRRYGSITWTTELREALNGGKPFLILCLRSTYTTYVELSRNAVADAVDDEAKRKLIQTLTEIEAQRNLTVVPFDHGNFPDVYRREASKIFTEGLALLQQRFQREGLAELLGNPADMTNAELASAEEVATDDVEDKRVRKRAIMALVDRLAASPETAIALLESGEQGVQRLAVQHLPALYRQRPPDPEFLADCVTVANDSGDVGVVRRLIPAMFQLDVGLAVEALIALDLSEIGTRRRLAGELERHELELVDPRLRELAITLLERCAQDTKDVGWLARCRACRDRLKDAAPTVDQ